MGIKKINAFLKEKCPTAFRNVQLNLLSNYKIAVDASGFIYNKVAASNKEYIMRMADPLIEINRTIVIKNTLLKMIEFIYEMSQYNITLIWCWDGVHSPEKIIAKTERKKAKETLVLKIINLYNELINVEQVFRQKNKISEYRLLLSQYNYVHGSEMDYFKSFIENLGLPSIQAETEGEKIASYLSINNYCNAVWSEDTDNYALGTPLLITGFNSTTNVSVVVLDDILSTLKITQETLTDFCIMCGTDFNKNIPRIAVIKSWNLLSVYKSIDNLQIDVSVLNHIRVREIFRHTNIENIDVNFNAEKFRSNVDVVINAYELNLYESHIKSLIKLEQNNHILITDRDLHGYSSTIIEEEKINPREKLKELIENAKI